MSGFENCEILEQLCLQSYKIILQGKKSTPVIISYGELGRYPISITFKSRMIGFWQRIIGGKPDKISHRLYEILMIMHQKDFLHSKWLLSIENTLQECDKYQFWLDQVAPKGIHKIVESNLVENYKQLRKETVFESQKCFNYRIFKQSIELEKYFNILWSDLALAFFHFRSLNHKFPIE